MKRRPIEWYKEIQREADRKPFAWMEHGFLIATALAIAILILVGEAVGIVQ